MIQGKSNKINNNSLNTNLDTPSTQRLEKSLTFGIGCRVNTNTLSQVTSFPFSGLLTSPT